LAGRKYGTLGGYIGNECRYAGIVLVEVNELLDEQRPRSADPDFWNAWTLTSPRPVNWSTVAREWTGDEE